MKSLNLLKLPPLAEWWSKANSRTLSRSQSQKFSSKGISAEYVIIPTEVEPMASTSTAWFK